MVLFSSHEMETVERVCSRVVILHKGRIVANDSIEQLRALMSLPTLEGIFSQLAIEQDTAGITRQFRRTHGARKCPANGASSAFCIATFFSASWIWNSSRSRGEASACWPSWRPLLAAFSFTFTIYFVPRYGLSTLPLGETQQARLGDQDLSDVVTMAIAGTVHGAGME